MWESYVRWQPWGAGHGNLFSLHLSHTLQHISHITPKQRPSPPCVCLTVSKPLPSLLQQRVVTLLSSPLCTPCHPPVSHLCQALKCHFDLCLSLFHPIAMTWLVLVTELSFYILMLLENDWMSCPPVVSETTPVLLVAAAACCLSNANALVKAASQLSSNQQQPSSSREVLPLGGMKCHWKSLIEGHSWGNTCLEMLRDLMYSTET